MIDGAAPDIFDRYADLELQRDFWKQAAADALALLRTQELVNEELRTMLDSACCLGLSITNEYNYPLSYRAFTDMLAKARADDGPEET